MLRPANDSKHSAPLVHFVPWTTLSLVEVAAAQYRHEMVSAFRREDDMIQLLPPTSKACQTDGFEAHLDLIGLKDSSAAGHSVSPNKPNQYEDL